MNKEKSLFIKTNVCVCVCVCVCVRYSKRENGLHVGVCFPPSLLRWADRRSRPFFFPSLSCLPPLPLSSSSSLPPSGVDSGHVALPVLLQEECASD